MENPKSYEDLLKENELLKVKVKTLEEKLCIFEKKENEYKKKQEDIKNERLNKKEQAIKLCDELGKKRIQFAEKFGFESMFDLSKRYHEPPYEWESYIYWSKSDQDDEDEEYEKFKSEIDKFLFPISEETMKLFFRCPNAEEIEKHFKEYKSLLQLLKEKNI